MNNYFKIYATSDVHGYVEPYLYSDQLIADLGMARISTILNNLKDENTICIDNGDAIQGSPLVFYHNLKHLDEIHPMSKVLKAMPYDYMNLGNHDFNLGMDVLLRHMEYVNIPCITVNVIYKGNPLGHYVIHEFSNGTRIALFGLVTQHIPNWEKPENIVGVEYIDAYEACKNTVEYIRNNEKVDVVVCAYHGGFERDLHTGVPTEVLNGENKGYEICKDIKGLDILITGHQHRSIADVCCGKITTQTASNAKEVAEITYNTDAHSGTSRLIKADAKPDERVLDLVSDLEAECQNWLDQPLGTCTQDLKIHNPFEARLHKHPLISFLNDVQLSTVKGDLSAVALFNDAKGFNHEITMRDIVSTYVFANTLTVIRMNRSTLKKFLEKCAEYFEVIDDEIQVSPRFMAPKPQHYNYDMVDGIEYTIKVSNPVGERIISLTKDGKEIGDNEEFDLIVSNYRAGGGGDFEMVHEGKTVHVDQKDMVEAIAEYILKDPEIKINHRENITVIK